MSIEQDGRYEFIIDICDALQTDPWSVMVYDEQDDLWRRTSLVQDVMKKFDNSISKDLVIRVVGMWLAGRQIESLNLLKSVRLLPLLTRKATALMSNSKASINLS